jgi:hypothetical protein
MGGDMIWAVYGTKRVVIEIEAPTAEAAAEMSLDMPEEAWDEAGLSVDVDGVELMQGE